MLAGLVSLLFPSSARALDALRTGVSPIIAAYDASREVDVELVLAVDISQSMDTDEQEVQRAGYVSAITSPDVLEAVRFGPIGRIAVTYLEWGGVDEHFIVANWTVIQDEASAASFAAQIAESPLRQVQRTSIASALTKAVEMMQTNSYNSMRQVIDISGDGPNNQGGSVTKARDKLLTTGVTINGLPLMMKSSSNAWQAMLNLDQYYEDCVIGGPGSFTIPVRSKEGFADAIKMKLVMEIAGLQMQRPLVQQAADRKPVQCSIFD
ncbi:DUF1194 domain-containing protein [Roseibium litorale]|uniref:DUF1194 domain-containing protein n=1 Tax=Roseibium litorale TaxID=2803841 RepID=UPI003CCCEE0A